MGKLYELRSSESDSSVKKYDSVEVDVDIQHTKGLASSYGRKKRLYENK